jgi:serine/threonine protein kinase
MVHRDVKPENILVVDEGPGLLDFGIARDIDEEATTTTVEGRVRGTPAYMAPERFFGAPASVRSDVYELGVVLYTMLVGRLPWGSEKNVTDRLNPASPRDAGADVSSSLATVILRALSTRPETRPASALDLAREVTAAAAALDSAPESRRTVDVAIERAPEDELPFAETTIAPSVPMPASVPLPASHRPSAPSLSTPPSPATTPPPPSRARTAALVGGALAIAIAAALGGRALGRDPSGPGSPAPAACAAPDLAPSTSSAPAASAALVASTAPAPSAPSSVAPAPSASGSVRPRVAPPATSSRPSSSSPPPAASDPGRYFEDRR